MVETRPVVNGGDIANQGYHGSCGNAPAASKMVTVSIVAVEQVGSQSDPGLSKCE